MSVFVWRVLKRSPLRLYKTTDENHHPFSHPYSELRSRSFVSLVSVSPRLLRCRRGCPVVPPPSRHYRRSTPQERFRGRSSTFHFRVNGHIPVSSFRRGKWETSKRLSLDCFSSSYLFSPFAYNKLYVSCPHTALLLMGYWVSPGPRTFGKKYHLSLFHNVRIYENTTPYLPRSSVRNRTLTKKNL